MSNQCDVKIISPKKYWFRVFKVLNQYLNIPPLISIIEEYWCVKLILSDDILHDLAHMSDVYICSGVNKDFTNISIGDMSPHEMIHNDIGHCYCSNISEWFNTEALLLNFRSKEFKNVISLGGEDFVKKLETGGKSLGTVVYGNRGIDPNGIDNIGIDDVKHPFTHFFESKPGYELSKFYHIPLVFTDKILSIYSEDEIKPNPNGNGVIDVGIRSVKTHISSNQFFTLGDLLLSTNPVIGGWIYFIGLSEGIPVISSKPLPSYHVYNENNVIPFGMTGCKLHNEELE